MDFLSPKPYSAVCLAVGSNDCKKIESQPVSLFQKTDMSAWFNLFADLDPLADPDAVGRQPNENTGPGQL